MSARISWGTLKSIIVLLILSSCNPTIDTDGPTKAQYKAKVKADDSTIEMIQRVKAAGTAIKAQEARYILNQKKVDHFEKQLDEMEVGADRNLVLYDYGIELLSAGHTDKAIEVFTNFHDFFTDKIFLDKQKTLTEFKTQLGVSYLRKAEQENCLLTHNNESCIIPIS